MTSQGEPATVPEVPNFDGRINAAAGQNVLIEVYADDPFGVTLQYT